jgi:hypothetical protein
VIFLITYHGSLVDPEGCPPSQRLRRDKLPSLQRRERRLEARGFEPLTSSLQSWRSTN